MKYSIDIETPLSIDDFVLFDYKPDPSQHIPIGAMYIGKIVNIDYIQVEDEHNEDNITQNFTDTKIELSYLTRGFCIEDMDNYEKKYGCRPNKIVTAMLDCKNLITKLNPDVVSIMYNHEICNIIEDKIKVIEEDLKNNNLN